MQNFRTNVCLFSNLRLVNGCGKGENRWVGEMTYDKISAYYGLILNQY